MWQYQTPDELYHYGVVGMRWGHRKAQISAAGHKVMAGVYKTNEKFYSKNNRNRTLASMNAAAKKEQLAKASAASRKATTQKKKLDAAVAERKQASEKKRKITTASNYYEAQKKANRVIRAGAHAKIAGEILSKAGKMTYEQCKNNATRGQVAAVRILGYTGAALSTGGSMAVAGGVAQRRSNFRNYHNIRR